MWSEVELGLPSLGENRGGLDWNSSKSISRLIDIEMPVRIELGVKYTLNEEPQTWGTSIMRESGIGNTRRCFVFAMKAQ